MRLHGVWPVTAGVLAILASACSGGSGSGTDSVGTTSTDLALGGSSGDGALLRRVFDLDRGSTVPPNGDLNPYGIAFVPDAFPAGGLIDRDDVLVSNFNNSANLQGTGTTIVRVNPGRPPTVFFENPNAPGFSTALGVLQRGFVLVGNVPSTNGSGVACGPNPADTTPVNVGQGAIQIIDRHGTLVSVLASAQLLDGPWDLFVDDHGATANVFVSNALSGTVTRLGLSVGDTLVTVTSATQIASGYVHRCDPAAFLVAPTGLALDRGRDVLFVASTGDNVIFAVPDASDRTTDAGRGVPVVTDQAHLHGPLGLVRAPNGDLISAQGDAVNPDPHQQSEIVEFTADGKFVTELSVDPDTAGAAFGVALDDDADKFAAVNDDSNTADIWQVRR